MRDGVRRVRGARGEGCGLRGQGAAGAAQASSLSRGRTGGRAARGVPGSSETAISETARPCERMRSDERAERPQSVTSDLQPGDVLETSSTALQSITGQSDSTSSTCSGSTGGEAVRGGGDGATGRRRGVGGEMDGGRGQGARSEGRGAHAGPGPQRGDDGRGGEGKTEGGACLQLALVAVGRPRPRREREHAVAAADRDAE